MLWEASEQLHCPSSKHDSVEHWLRRQWMWSLRRDSGVHVRNAKILLSDWLRRRRSNVGSSARTNSSVIQEKVLALKVEKRKFREAYAKIELLALGNYLAIAVLYRLVRHEADQEAGVSSLFPRL
eukprot:753841-Hanusia_phi.AAC.1